jgi:PIN domain nuclease of toxin-antitoxin system
MNLLIDTQIFIWWADKSERLPQGWLDLLSDSENSLLLSVVSVWEIQIKVQLGKLQMHKPLRDVIVSQQNTNNFTILPVFLPHVLALNELPLHHKDPFDRLIIAQAITEDLTVLSTDSNFSRYTIKLAA